MSEIRERILARIEEVKKASTGKTGHALRKAERRMTDLKLCLLIHDSLATEGEGNKQNGFTD